VISSTSGLSNAENSYECDFLERDGKARIEMTMLGAPMITGFDGKSSWQQFGDWVAPASESMSELIADEYKHGLASLLNALDPTKTKVESVPRLSVQGKLCDGVKVTTSTGNTSTFYADPVSHLVLRSDYEGTDHELGIRELQSIEYSDYRKVGSSMEPFKIVRFSGKRKKTETIVKSIDANVVIDEKAFQMPPESEIAQLKNGPLTVPFEYSGNEIIIKGRLNNGAEQRFIVDTGASHTVIDKAAAASMGSKPISTFSVTSGTKGVPLAYTKIPSITIGDVTLHDVPTLVTDLSNIGEKPAGVIGANILRRFLVTIDYDERKLILSDPRHVTVAPKAVAIPTKPVFSGTAMIVKGQLNDKVPMNFFVDTGASFNHLPQTLAKPIYPGAILKVGSIYSIDGHEMGVGALKAKSLRIGSLNIPNVVFTIAPDNNPNLSGLFTASTMGILGNPIWSQFKTTIDYRNERLILEPRPGHDKYIALMRELEQIDRDYLKSKNDDEAFKAYEKLMAGAQVEQQKAVQALAASRMGDVYVRKYKASKDTKVFDLALSEFERAEKLANESRNRNVQGQVLAAWGLAYFDAERNYNEIASGQKLLLKALDKAPTDPTIFATFGTSLLRANKAVEAEKFFDRTLVLDPSNWHALWGKHKLYQDGKHVKEAALIVEQLQLYYPSFPEVVALAPPAVKQAQAKPKGH
jgi:predicted aspartyl protease/Flp pilus assembly protein TadD